MVIIVQFYLYFYLTSVFVEVNLFSIHFDLINDLYSCGAYLQINDSIEPFNSEVCRSVSSAELILLSNELLNNTSIQINDSSIIIACNHTKVASIIQYVFRYNNYSTVESYDVPLSEFSLTKMILFLLHYQYLIQYFSSEETL